MGAEMGTAMHRIGVGIGLAAALAATSSAVASPVRQGGVRFENTALHVERPGMPFRASNPSLTSVRAGQAIRLALYVYVYKPSMVGPAHVSLTISDPVGRNVFVSNGTFNLARRDAGGSASGWRWFWNTVRACGPGPTAPQPGCLPQTPGRYTVRGSIRTRSSGSGWAITLAVAGR